MASTTNSELSHGHDYDLIVLGGGSGGLGCARRAALRGAKAAIVEAGPMGGTCVNVGCVPKKVGFNAASLAESLKHLQGYGFEGATDDAVSQLQKSFSMAAHKKNRDAYVHRLNDIYHSNLAKGGVAEFKAWGTLQDKNTILLKPVDGAAEMPQTISAAHIVIATGGKPSEVTFPGGEHTINSNGFFDLTTIPGRVVVIGAGYVAVELAGILHTLGSDVFLCVRNEHFLRSMDDIISHNLKKEMEAAGVHVCSHKTVERITLEANGQKRVHFTDGKHFEDIDLVINAVGRDPLTKEIGLEKVGVEVDSHGFIKVDDYQNTNIPGIYALGDVCGKVPLTPVAIAAGRKLAERVWGGIPDAKMDYTDVATVVFSHPPAATVGLTQTEAVEQFGENNVIVHTSVFRNMYYAVVPEELKQRTYMKIVCSLEGGDAQAARKDTKLQRVVGIHMLGLAVDEVIQGFAVALKMGATKHDLDRTCAIHPTAAEELVTM